MTETTALPSGEDALREAVRLAALEEAAMIAQTFGVPGGHIGDTARAVAVAIRRRAALQSPRASDEVLADASGHAAARAFLADILAVPVPDAAFVADGIFDFERAVAKVAAALSASSVPVDASGDGSTPP